MYAILRSHLLVAWWLLGAVALAGIALSERLGDDAVAIIAVVSATVWLPTLGLRSLIGDTMPALGLAFYVAGLPLAMLLDALVAKTRSGAKPGSAPVRSQRAHPLRQRLPAVIAVTLLAVVLSVASHTRASASAELATTPLPEGVRHLSTKVALIAEPVTSARQLGWVFGYGDDWHEGLVVYVSAQGRVLGSSPHDALEWMASRRPAP